MDKDHYIAKVDQRDKERHDSLGIIIITDNSTWFSHLICKRLIGRTEAKRVEDKEPNKRFRDKS